MRVAGLRPLAVPEWMTRPEAAEAKIVVTPRLPVAVLLALRSETMAGLSSCEQMVQEEYPDVSAKGQIPAATLRRSSPDTDRKSTASGDGATPPRADAMDAGPGGHDAQGGRW